MASPIDVYNHGNIARDFTCIDDLVEAVVRLIDCVPSPGKDDSVSPVAPFRIVNIGRNEPVYLLLERLTGYRPRTALADGVAAFVDWFRDYKAGGALG